MDWQRLRGMKLKAKAPLGIAFHFSIVVGIPWREIKCLKS